MLLLSAGDAWFNGSVIDTALAHLQQFASQQPGLAPVACFPSQYPTHASLEDTQHKTSMDAVKTWPRPVDDLAACQHLVFPINHSTLPTQQKHWTVLIVTPLSSSITFVDSYHALPGLERRCHEAVLGVTKLLQAAGFPQPVGGWEIREAVSPQQPHRTGKCGLFLLAAIRQLTITRKLHFDFTTDDTRKLRASLTLLLPQPVVVMPSTLRLDGMKRRSARCAGTAPFISSSPAMPFHMHPHPTHPLSLSSCHCRQC